MATLREAVGTGLSVVVATSAVFAGFVSAPVAGAGPDQLPSAPCYNGIAPMNPYINNCAIPSRPPRVLGSAPDQTAILNCSVGGAAWRAVCLSQFVNGGSYPGFVVGIG